VGPTPFHHIDQGHAAAIIETRRCRRVFPEGSYPSSALTGEGNNGSHCNRGRPIGVVPFSRPYPISRQSVRGIEEKPPPGV